MHWILQSSLFNDREWNQLTAVLNRFDIPYSVHKVIPFVGELIPEAKPASERVICFGSYSMRHSARKFGWTPGVYDLEPYDFLVQREHWGKEMLNSDSVVVPFKDVKIRKPMFLRPANDGKVFAGKIYEPDEFHKWQFNVVAMNYDYGNSLTNDTLIQVSEPKQIYAEYRFWIVEGKIVTWSLYKRGSKVIYSSDVDGHVLKYAESIPVDWLPKALVLDVCETDQGMKIMEINTINSAGFYAADILKLVMALEDI
jgi:hypothetical protein